MSLQETIRGWLDPPATRRLSIVEAPTPADGDASFGPVDSGVRTWLAQELPRLRDDGLLTSEQAESIARRYGVPPRTPDEAAPTSAPRAGAARSPGPSLAPFLSEHGVSLVLYLGAFLVVSAVTVFLAYAWGEVGGLTKLAALLGLTAGFLAAAGLCLRRPSVRLAGRTFLALGAVLVPTNAAAAYQFVYAGGPLPQAAFWLLGAVSSGALWAALSLRLDSRLYGGISALTPPIAVASSASLLGVPTALLPPLAVATLALLRLAADVAGDRPLTRATRLVACWLLPIAAAYLMVDLVWSPTGPTLRDIQIWGTGASLVITAVSLAGEALRPTGLWGAGPIAGLIVALLGSAVYGDARLSPLALTSAALAWLFVAVARRLAGRPSVAWDRAGGLLALAPAIAAWDDWPLSAGLLAAAAVLLGLISAARRSPAALYPATLAVDLAYVRATTTFGSPDSPDWTLGLVLWPLALVWWGFAAGARPGWVGPFRAAALGTGAAAVLLAEGRPELRALMAASFAAVSAAVAWRAREPLGLAWVGLWLTVLGHHGATWLRLDLPTGLAAAGLAAWVPIAAFGRSGAVRMPVGAMSETPTAPTSKRRRAPGQSLAMSFGPVRADWTAAAYATGAGMAALSAVLLAVRWGETDSWLIASAVAWANLAAILALASVTVRSGLLAAIAATAVVPAMLAAIQRLHPADAQAYAVPVGLYLVGVAYLARRRAPSDARGAVTALATVGVAALLGPGIYQALDARLVGHALWTATEGLLLAGWGIATRWRPPVAGGVAAVATIAVRQLFDVANALPSWVLLGGTGLGLLAGAVALLVQRGRLGAAGRLISDRWTAWD